MVLYLYYWYVLQDEHATYGLLQGLQGMNLSVQRERYSNVCSTLMSVYLTTRGSCLSANYV